MRPNVCGKDFLAFWDKNCTAEKLKMDIQVLFNLPLVKNQPISVPMWYINFLGPEKMANLIRSGALSGS